MHRSRSSIPYDILNGINYSSNVSAMLAYLSYFPPPPPVLPSPPPQRSWTCSVGSLSSSSCLVSDDLNPPSLRTYVPLLFINSSHISKTTHQNFKSSSILDFFQNQLSFILLLIIFLSIFIFVIILLLLFLYIQRLRQRQLTSNSHIQTNNNTNNLELNNKNKKFYYHLIPYRDKYQKHSPPLTNTNDENNSSRLTNHESPVLEVKRLSKTIGIYRNDHQEQEESL
jgi:hypothetical protein